MSSLRTHWPEYVSEAICLAIFMVSAALFATLLQHPASPVSPAVPPGVLGRVPMGLAMGLTAIGIIYSRLGQRSGAHMNPAVTLTFLRLRKISRGDAAWYVLAQFAGGVTGIIGASAVLAGLPAHPTVNYVATVPGAAGWPAAFVAEAAISFGMMLTILVASNHPRVSRFTGFLAGVLVFSYITVEAPLSGMSMNPARSLGPAILARSLDSIWIYFSAPLAGMLLAAEAFVRHRGIARVICAKLHHSADVPCIFRCGYGARVLSPSVSTLSAGEVSV